jgi:hypothetical protein
MAGTVKREEEALIVMDVIMGVLFLGAWSLLFGNNH